MEEANGLKTTLKTRADEARKIAEEAKRLLEIQANKSGIDSKALAEEQKRV